MSVTRDPLKKRGRHGTPAPATVSSVEVNRALRGAVWPALAEVGFRRRSTRTAWRDRPDQVEVVNFQSFNAYKAEGLGVTSHSFAVNLGVFPRCRASDRTPEKAGQLQPPEYQCDFRRSLGKTIQQPECARTTLWYVSPSGENLDSVVADAVRVVLGDGLQWFARLDGVAALLRIAETVPDGDRTATWGMGHFGSPHRLALTAALRDAVAQPAQAAHPLSGPDSAGPTGRR
jgi:hypothetical protein